MSYGDLKDLSGRPKAFEVRKQDLTFQILDEQKHYL